MSSHSQQNMLDNVSRKKIYFNTFQLLTLKDIKPSPQDISVDMWYCCMTEPLAYRGAKFLKEGGAVIFSLKNCAKNFLSRSPLQQKLHKSPSKFFRNNVLLNFKFAYQQTPPTFLTLLLLIKLQSSSNF